MHLLVCLPESVANLPVLFLPSTCLLRGVDDLDHHHAWDDALALGVPQLLPGLGVYALAELEGDVLERGDLGRRLRFVHIGSACVRTT